MKIKYDRFFQNPKQLLSVIRPWLSDLSRKHVDFRYDASLVVHGIHDFLAETGMPPQQIFPGVFAVPIGHFNAKDAKLVPLKLVKIMPGAIIPLHRHGGSEYYQLLPGSELIDTRGCYDEHQACISEKNDIHAVMNIGIKSAYALIALPTTLKLDFLNEEDAFFFLEQSHALAKFEEQYQPHQLFLKLLYIEQLLKRDVPKAQILLNQLDLKNISHTVQIRQTQNLQALLKQEIEETLPFQRSKL